MTELGRAIRIDSLLDPAGNLSAAIESFMIYCRSKNLSGCTIGYYGYRLEAFRRYVEAEADGRSPREIMRQDIRGFLEWEINHNSPSTANHSLTSMRAFFRFLVSEGYLQSSPTDGVEKVRTSRRIIQTFSGEHIEAVLKTCGKDFLGLRDRAILLVLFDCGLRASELCNLTLEDIDWKEQTLKVIGKGEKPRSVSFGQATLRALSQYYGRRPDLDADRLFVSCFGQPLNRFRLAEIVKTRCKTAEITGVRCSPHTFRHTFAVRYLLNGGDVFSLQKLLGHSDLTMTRRYCELSDTDALQRHRMYSPADSLQSSMRPERRQRIR